MPTLPFSSDRNREQDCADLLACAARLLGEMGVDNSAFSVVVEPDLGARRLNVAIRLDRRRGEALPALAASQSDTGESPTEAEQKPLMPQWVLFSPLETKILGCLMKRAGAWTKTDDIAESIKESSSGELKAVLRNLAERSQGQLESAPGRGWRLRKEEGLSGVGTGH